MSATINDVAREAGVSITTVSRALNNNYPVSKEAREKIEKAVERLNYKPNIVARSLVLKKTSMIGVIIPGITNMFFPIIVEEIDNILRTKGYSLSLCNTRGDCKTEVDLVENIILRGMDGIIAIDPSFENIQNGYYEKINKIIPTIIINANSEEYKCNFVSYDEEAGTVEAFDYLFKLGHSRIAFIRGDKSYSYNLKEKMYKRIIKEKELKYQKIINVGMGNSIEVVNKTETSFKKLLDTQERPTSVFCCNDLMALGVINACNKAGLCVPEDISVIGFDNTLLSDVSHPKITTVDLNMKEIGRIAALELVSIISRGISCRKKTVLDTKLIIKESCSRPL
ncbi:LacI family DNA-binding transcriptional regulator [Lutispora sp.]|nr:LacI family DNA-binding transcriptional regulator [Lutispora sp.]MEA4960922.1 LacI family DNA-binding transcriptional regulator [Lutispora sp.]